MLSAHVRCRQRSGFLSELRMWELTVVSFVLFRHNLCTSPLRLSADHCPQSPLPLPLVGAHHRVGRLIWTLSIH